MRNKRQPKIGDKVEAGELRGRITRIENIPSPAPDGVLIEYAYLESCTYRGTYRHGCPAPSQYIELNRCRRIE